MLSRTVRIQSLIAPTRAFTPMRQYTNSFKNREEASENMYFRQKEKEEIEALQKKLKEAEKKLEDIKDELKDHINNSKGQK
ncbi:hypothetical protein H4219_000729 [Mycoemilia scoparia]|uniref:ATPase inhibitor, mitochondrial n=1 Tax=Mycoemilia scoparia TaxID=417184 RepID=A0A9W8A8M0_9FUNG|nr:hypothetical protein H4219_000729 [Mycoemilia scoparia]